VSVTPSVPWAGLPDGGPATLAGVKLILGIRAEDETDDPMIQAKVDAVNSIMSGLPIAELAVDADTWPARIIEGANMLAARWVRRRNSPAGVEAMGEFGAAYVMRSDPDIAQLLQLGSWAPPAVG